MNRLFKAISLLLIPALAIAISAPSAWAGADHFSHSAAPEQVGGSCHSDGKRLSDPRASDSRTHFPISPVSYKCCLVGHTAMVLVRSADFSQLVASHAPAGARIGLPQAGTFLNSTRIPAVSSADPPHTSPLRI